MKRTMTIGTTAVVLASMMFLGFQCGSPEFTGAKVYINQKNYKEAMRLLEIETQKNPGNEEAWYLLGSLRSETSDYKGMNVAFTEALKLTSKHENEIKTRRYNLWATLTNSGVNVLQRASSDSLTLYDRAIEDFQKATVAWPDTMITYRYLGYAHSGKGDQENALSSYRTAWQKGKDKESYMRAGRIFLQRGKDQKTQFETENADKIRAIGNLKMIERGMAKADVMKLLGAPDNVRKGARGTRKEDWTYSRYNLSVGLDGDRVVSRTMSRAYSPQIDSTKHHAAMVEFSKAVDVFEEVKAFDSTDNDNLNLLLQAFVESERIKDAVVGFSQAVVNDPDNKLNRYILGVLHRTAGDYDSAIKEFREALRIDPQYVEAMYDLGATYYNWGVDIIKDAQEKGVETTEYKDKFKEAVPLFEKVTEFKKDDPQVWETLANIYARLGQSEKAVKALDTADKIRKGN